MPVVARDTRFHTLLWLVYLRDLELDTGKRKYRKDRKSTKGYAARHPDGKLARATHGGSRNTACVQVRVTPTNTSKLEFARLDRRTWAGRIYTSTVKDLVSHMGGDPSYAQQLLIDQCARLRIAADVAWGGAMKAGLDTDSPAFQNFLRASRNQREILHLLGLERQSRPVSLNDYIESRDAHGSS